MTLLSPPRRIALLLLLCLVHSTGVLGECPYGMKSMVVYGKQIDSNYCFYPVAGCEMHNTNGCAKCAGAASVSADEKSCIPCTVPNCARCSAPNKCASCTGGLVPNMENYASCVTQRPSCAEHNARGECTKCLEHYILRNGYCTLCNVPNCAYCEGENICKLCTGDLMLTSTGKCIGRVEHCATLTDTGICTACESGYTLVEGHCVECKAPNCQKCEFAANQCSMCNSGLILTAEYKCITCNVPQCRKCTDNDVCVACEDGYGVVEGGKCEPCKIEGCLICTYNAYECNMDLQKATVAKEKKGIPWWVWLIVAIAAAALLGIILFIILWCCLRKPIVPVTVYEEDNYDSEKDSGDDQTRDLELDFNNRSFFARPPPILIMNDYVQPRIFVQDNNEVHGDLSSAAADSELSSGSGDESGSSSGTGDSSEHN
ncbi:hypothetical protein, conserved [Angomonas deanei]|uniref:Uncharacterized protein n=1 Tax=Angomonas deanei TaxID=59799 RepID=A0A7G2CB00_9TRYP|nr:hypothetical protein, conserved [Angomonas deanei]